MTQFRGLPGEKRTKVVHPDPLDEFGGEVYETMDEETQELVDRLMECVGSEVRPAHLEGVIFAMALDDRFKDLVIKFARRERRVVQDYMN